MAPTHAISVGAPFELPPWTRGDETDDESHAKIEAGRKSMLRRSRASEAKRKRQGISDLIDSVAPDAAASVADGIGALLPTDEPPPSAGLLEEISTESADEGPGSDGIDDPNSESEAEESPQVEASPPPNSEPVVEEPPQVEAPPPPPSTTSVEAPPVETPPPAEVIPPEAQPTEALPSEAPVPELPSVPTLTPATQIDIVPSATLDVPALVPSSSTTSAREIPPLSTAIIESSSTGSVIESEIFPTAIPVTQDLTTSETEVLVTNTSLLTTPTPDVNPGGGEEEEEEESDDGDVTSDDDSGDESPGFGPTITFSDGSLGLPETTRVPGSSTINPGPFPDFMDPERQKQFNHHRKVETALTVIGSLAGAIVVGLCIWFFLRFKKRHQARQRAVQSGNFSQFSPQETSPPPNYASYMKPSLATRVLSRVPFFKDRVADRTWYGIDDPYMTANEKRSVGDTMMSGDGGGIMAYMPSKPPATVSPWRTSQRDLRLDTSAQMLNGPGVNPMAMHPAGLHPASLNPTVYTSPISQVSPRQMSPQQSQQLYYAQHVVSPTSPGDNTDTYNTITTFNVNTGTLNSSQENTSLSYPRSESTLSSAFGNGTYVCPTPLFKPGGEESVRDSTITQSTVSVGSDGRPRFRTISAWVRHQTNRVERQSQVPDMPPEQDFNMMMPDEQAPRRVDELPNDGAEYGVAR